MPIRIGKYPRLVYRLQQRSNRKQCCMKILLLSAYDAASHRHWREMLVTGFPEHDWTVLTLPPRHFNWRMRGNALSWAMNAGEGNALI